MKKYFCDRCKKEGTDKEIIALSDIDKRELCKGCISSYYLTEKEARMVFKKTMEYWMKLK